MEQPIVPSLTSTPVKSAFTPATPMKRNLDNNDKENFYTYVFLLEKITALVSAYDFKPNLPFAGKTRRIWESPLRNLHRGLRHPSRTQWRLKSRSMDLLKWYEVVLIGLLSNIGLNISAEGILNLATYFLSVIISIVRKDYNQYPQYNQSLNIGRLIFHFIFQPDTPNSLEELCEVISSQEREGTHGSPRKRPRPIDHSFKVGYILPERIYC